MPYQFPASTISAVAGRNKYRDWKDAAAYVLKKYNLPQTPPYKKLKDK